MGKSKVVSKQPVRLYTKGLFMGYKRSLKQQTVHTSLLKLDGVSSQTDAKFYFGKRVAYIYKTDTMKKGSKMRCIWGKILRAHGSNGVVRAKFKRNLPPKAIGGPVRVMLYPSSI